MAVRRARGGRKRGFRKYGSPVQAGWNRSGGAGEPGDPYELTMNSVRLTSKIQPFGMDETRKRNMRRMLWYWQWSRDWNWRQVTTISGLQPDRQAHPVLTFETKPEEDQIKAGPTWYWAWPKGRKGKRKSPRDLKNIISKRGTELMHWMVSLNPRQQDEQSGKY